MSITKYHCVGWRFFKREVPPNQNLIKKGIIFWASFKEWKNSESSSIPYTTFSPYELFTVRISSLGSRIGILQGILLGKHFIVSLVTVFCSSEQGGGVHLEGDTVSVRGFVQGGASDLKPLRALSRADPFLRIRKEFHIQQTTTRPGHPCYLFYVSKFLAKIFSPPNFLKNSFLRLIPIQYCRGPRG